MELKDLFPNKQNPRKITDEKLKMLDKSLKAFGDLSGFVFNRRTNRLVSGHQRQKVMPPGSKLIVTETYATPTSDGTVRLGYIEAYGKKFNYREVDLDEVTEKAMNIAANQHGGSFDMTILPEWINELDSLNIDLDLLGFDSAELESMMAPIGASTPDVDLDFKLKLQIEFEDESVMQSVFEELKTRGFKVKVLSI